MGFSLGKIFKGYSAFGDGLKGVLGGGGDPGKAQFAQMMDIYRREQANQGYSFAQARQRQQQAVGAIKEGFGAARKNVGQVYSGARQNAVDQGQQVTAATQQGMTDRGLYNTTVLDNAKVGIAGNVTHQLAQIDSMYAAALSDLDTGEAGALANAYTGQAGLYATQSAQSGALAGQMAQGVASVQYEDPNAWLYQLLGIGGQLAGAAIGKAG